MKSASTTNEKKAMQNVIFNCTKTALKGKTVSKIVRALGSGSDEQEWKINGFEKNVFVFHTKEYGKEVTALAISAEAKSGSQNNVLKETFNDVEFIKKMHNLFVNKEKEMFRQKTQQTLAVFVESFKSNIK